MRLFSYATQYNHPLDIVSATAVAGIAEPTKVLFTLTLSSHNK